jgi:hypothetical protein
LRREGATITERAIPVGETITVLHDAGAILVNRSAVSEDHRPAFGRGFRPPDRPALQAQQGGQAEDDDVLPFQSYPRLPVSRCRMEST